MLHVFWDRTENLLQLSKLPEDRRIGLGEAIPFMTGVGVFKRDIPAAYGAPPAINNLCSLVNSAAFRHKIHSSFVTAFI